MNFTRTFAVFLGSLLLGGTPALGETPPVPAATDEAAADVSDDTGPTVLGWVEHVRMLPGRVLMKAKLDTGAKSSALHAENIEYFQQDGRDMVRFTVLREHRNPDSDRFVYERPLEREVNIKLRYTNIRDERPAVRLDFCIAGERHNALFTLTNRSGFNYPILLGREFLQHGVLVDSTESFTHRTRCPRT